MLLNSRDQCAYKKEGNAEDTYCFKTQGATHTTECVETGVRYLMKADVCYIRY